MQKIHFGRLAEYSDSELSSLVIGGDSDAFVELASRYMSLVRSKASSYRTAILETDDLCQEGLLGLLSAARTYDPKENASFKTYAGVCISNRIIMACRKAASRKNKPLNDSISLSSQEDSKGIPLADSGADPEAVLAKGEELNCLRRRVKQSLSKLEQRVLFLYLGGCSYSEISTRLSITEKAADNALQRARRKLR